MYFLAALGLLGVAAVAIGRYASGTAPLQVPAEDSTPRWIDNTDYVALGRVSDDWLRDHTNAA